MIRLLGLVAIIAAASSVTEWSGGVISVAAFGGLSWLGLSRLCCMAEVHRSNSSWLGQLRGRRAMGLTVGTRTYGGN